MRLLNTSSLELEEFVGKAIPKYAILSHTWQKEEITLQDMQTGNSTAKAGFKKIQSFCAIAKTQKYSHIWVDTCCIEKSSSSELSEAINSMFHWYEEADVCYAYLEDVSATDEKLQDEEFGRCRWFSRGWTLQELIAPKELVFYSKDFERCSTKRELASRISEITNISERVLNGSITLSSVSLAKRMSWASKRETTREEDIAYCLLGIFGINLPLLYGEGKIAFTRLQEEIMRHSTDQSILAWKGARQPIWRGALASSPQEFQDSADIVPIQSDTEPFSITNRGVRISLPIIEKRTSQGHILQTAILSCRREGKLFGPLAIPVTQVSSMRTKIFKRLGSELPTVSHQTLKSTPFQDIHIVRVDETRSDFQTHGEQYFLVRAPWFPKGYCIYFDSELSTKGSIWNEDERVLRFPADTLQKHCGIEFRFERPTEERRGRPDFAIAFGLNGGMDSWSAFVDATFLPDHDDRRKWLHQSMHSANLRAERRSRGHQRHVRATQNEELSIEARVSWDTIMGLEVLILDVVCHDLAASTVFNALRRQSQRILDSLHLDGLSVHVTVELAFVFYNIVAVMLGMGETQKVNWAFCFLLGFGRFLPSVMSALSN